MVAKVFRYLHYVLPIKVCRQILINGKSEVIIEARNEKVRNIYRWLSSFPLNVSLKLLITFLTCINDLFRRKNKGF